MWTVLRRIGGEEGVSVVQYAGDKKYLMQLGVSTMPSYRTPHMTHAFASEHNIHYHHPSFSPKG